MSYSRKQQVSLTTPTLSETSKIVTVKELRGANICEVELPDGRRMLCQIPQKFRKLIWIKRGSYLIVNEPEALRNVDVKIRAMVEHILFPEHVKDLKREGQWPPEFEKDVSPSQTNKKKSNKQQTQRPDSEDEEEDDLFVNPNHQVIEDSDDEDEEDEEDDEEEEEDTDNNNTK